MGSFPALPVARLAILPHRRSWIASAAHPLAGPAAGVVHAPPFCSPSTTPTTRCSAKWQLGSLIHAVPRDAVPQ